MEVLARGKGASKGRVRGRVRVLRGDTLVAHGVIGSAIVVLRFLSPFKIPYVLDAAAIVTDYGGMASHGAIVARELGIPCIVDTKDATEVLSDGMEVVVDGDRGLVYR